MQQPIRLIVEGHDGAGKTTICKVLSNKINVPIYKCSKEKTALHFLNKAENIKLSILKWEIPGQLDLIEQCNASVIYDRFFPSEYAYARTLDRQTDDELVFEYDAWWNRLGGKIVFLYKQDCFIEDDELIPSTLFDDIKNEYVNYSMLTACDTLFLDTTDQDLDKQLEKIIRFLNQES